MIVQQLHGWRTASRTISWPSVRTQTTGQRKCRRKSVLLLGVALSSWWLFGCTQSQYEEALELSEARHTEASFIGPESVPSKFRQMEFAEIYQGRGSEHSGAARMLREVGLFEFPESYIINIPLSASFLADKELYAATHAHGRWQGADGRRSAATMDFERRVLFGASAAQAELERDLMERLFPEEGDERTSWTDVVAGSGALHEAFFSTLAQCGEESPWPNVQLFVMGQGYAALRVLTWSDVVEQGPVGFAGIEQDSGAVVVEVGDPERGALDELGEVVGCFGGAVGDL